VLQRRCKYKQSRPSAYITSCRTCTTRHDLKFGLMNVHSANDKIGNILSLRHERDLDVLLLCETWHDSDSDSDCIRRLHADGMRVVERVRPRVVNNMSSDHITAESLLRSQITRDVSLGLDVSVSRRSRDANSNVSVS